MIRLLWLRLWLRLSWLTHCSAVVAPAPAQATAAAAVKLMMQQ